MPGLIDALPALPHHLGPQGKGAYIGQDHFPDFPVPAFHGPLYGGPQCHCLIRMHGHIRELMEQLHHKILYHRHARGPAHQHYLVNVLQLQMRIRNALLDGSAYALQQRQAEFCIFPRIQGQVFFFSLYPAAHPYRPIQAEPLLGVLRRLMDIRPLLPFQTILIQPVFIVKLLLQYPGKILAPKIIIPGHGPHLQDGSA